jgi:MinD-like ATPase involved in chromosome partitioning or flagellar assembly
MTFQDLGNQIATEAEPGRLAEVAVSSPYLQKASNQRNIHSAFETLRSKFDYIVIDTEQGVSTSFATSVVAEADAVLVTVKKGRRTKSSDARLSAALERIGSRFLGILAVDPSAIRKKAAVVAIPSVSPELRRSHAATRG